MRRKNAKEMFGGFFKSMVKTADEVIISGVKVCVFIIVTVIKLCTLHTGPTIV